MTAVLADRALDGVAVCAAFDSGTIAARLAALGAGVSGWPAPADAGPEADAGAVSAAIGLPENPAVLVIDACALLADRPEEPVEALRHAIDSAFVVARAVAHSRWIEPGEPGGRIVLVGPGPGDGEHAAACAAALKNTARTLSVEWARFGIRVVAVLPRDNGDPDAVAELVAFLASDAGDYYSGCAIRPGEAPA